MVITDIADLERLAKRRLPRIIYSYVRGGGYEEETLRRNRRDLEKYALVPRVMRDVSHVSTETTMAGMRVAIPVGLDPVGACGLVWPNAEMEAARAAKAFGVPFCLSTLSICSVEDVAEATGGHPFWLQLYLMKDHRVGQSLIQRAKAHNVSTLVLSMDLHVRSQRHGEQRHGLVAPPKVNLANLWDGATHPRWALSMVKSRHKSFGNLEGVVEHAHNVFKITPWLEDQYDSTLDARTIDWLRREWEGQLLVKGVMHPEDAKTCVEHGADGVIVSNHGGRQVDGAISTMSVIPRIAEAVNGKGQVIVDSGIRSGIDVLKMMARGADACMIGRAYLWGLAWAGEKGVHKALDILHKELAQNMALCGQTDVRKLDPELLVEDDAFLKATETSDVRASVR